MVKISTIIRLLVVTIAIAGFITTIFYTSQYCPDCNVPTNTTTTTTTTTPPYNKWLYANFTLLSTQNSETVEMFLGKTIVVEISGMSCSRCTTQLPHLKEFMDIMETNDSFVLITLFVDIEDLSMVLNYRLDNSITTDPSSWDFGFITSTNIINIGASGKIMPIFYLLNSTSWQIDFADKIMNLSELQTFVGYS